MEIIWRHDLELRTFVRIRVQQGGYHRIDICAFSLPASRGGVNQAKGDTVKLIVKRGRRHLDRQQNQLIVKPSEEKTSREGVGRTDTGLTGHAGVSSMAAESYSNLALSSRQLLEPAQLAPSANDDFSVSRRVEYVPPTEAEVSQYARDVCAALSEAIPAGRFAEPEVRLGFQRFMIVVVRIVAKQATAKGAAWKSESDKNPPTDQA